MKYFLALALILCCFLSFSCATQMNDIEFAYFSKPQTDRQGIQDVFFNEKHSAYKKFRLYPEEVLEKDEKILFDNEKLPNNHHPVEDEWMEALVMSLDVQDFFDYGHSVASFKEAIDIFKSKEFIRQCIILIVDGNVTIALPPISPGTNRSKSVINKFNKKMKDFHAYSKVYIGFAGEFRRTDVMKTDSGFDIFKADLERSRKLSEKEKKDIEENREKREKVHGN